MDDNGLSPWAIKERERNGTVSGVREDEVLLDWDRALLLYQFSIAIHAQVSEADSAPRNARVLSTESPSRSSVCVSEHASVFALPAC